MISNLLSLKMFFHDDVGGALAGTGKWTTILLHCLGFGMIQRYFIVLSSGMSSRKELKTQPIDSIKSPDSSEPEDITSGTSESTVLYTYVEQLRDVSLLRFLYSFMETVPQVIIQLYILLEKVMKTRPKTPSVDLNNFF